MGTICDASFPTTMLRWWARDRPKGRIPVHDIVHQLTGRQANYLGLTDRGLVQAGRLADLNIIDHAGLTLHKPALHADLPAGGKRLLQRATGYRATVKSGQITFQDGVATGAHPGRLVRVESSAQPNAAP